MKLHIQIVNINRLEMTKQVVSDLFRQTHQFNLTIVDQGSTEPGTKEYLYSLREIPYIEVIYNDSNVDLNRLWNRLYRESNCPYLCFLNNDVRVPANFVEDIVNILDKEKSVGAVIHPTNHPDYQKTSKLNYAVLKDQIVQGWAFTLRREVYTVIPDDLKVFGGDDWLFVQMYRKHWKTAIALSAPIIHFHAKSRKYYKGDRQEEADALKQHGIERLPYYIATYTRQKPRFEKIIEGDDYQKQGLWYE